MGTPRSFDDYPKIMSTAQVAELIGYKVNRIRLLAQEGRIPAHREAGARAWWFNRDELIEWIRSATKVTPGAE